MNRSQFAAAFLAGILAFAARAEEPPTFVVSAGDVTRASVEMDTSDHITLVLSLTAEKRHEFTIFTTENLKKQVRIMLNGAVVSEPIVQTAITNGSVAISACSPEETLKTAKALLKNNP